MIWLAAFLGSSLLMPCALAAEPPSAAGADGTVNEGPHRISAEVGAFTRSKSDGVGPALGLGYAYRILRGLEGGVGLRYFLMPDRTSDDYVAQPVGSTLPPQHGVEPGYRLWFVGAHVRGYLPLAAGRVELGVSLGGGAMLTNDKVLPALSAAADVRVLVGRSTALELSPEFGVGSTGVYNGPNQEDDVDEVFGQASLWLRLVQTL